MQIVKFPLIDAGRGQEVTVAGFGEIVAFQYDSGMPCIWVEETPGQPERTITLKVFQFPMTIPDDAAHILTTFHMGQARHLYDVGSMQPKGNLPIVDPPVANWITVGHNDVVRVWGVVMEGAKVHQRQDDDLVVVSISYRQPVERKFA